MNNKKRSELSKVLSKIDEIRSAVESVIDDERDCLDGLESFEGTDRYASMEEGLEFLETAVESLGEAADAIGEAM